VPQFTVDRYGRLTVASTKTVATITGSSGLTVSSIGQISPNLGNGLALDGDNIAVNNGDGLSFNAGKLQINASQCTGNSQVLTWTGSAFSCVSGTDWNLQAEGATVTNIGDNATVNFASDDNLTAARTGNIITYSLDDTGVTAGTYNATGTATSGDYKFNIPIFTVDAQGQLTNASTTAFALTGGAGINLSSSGDISMPGILDGTANAKCTSAGQGLSWTGTEFGCTTAYYWNLGANYEETRPINSGDSVNFMAGAGMSVARATNNITYKIDLSAGSGLVIDNDSGIVKLADCPSGQILKATDATNGWACAVDLDHDTNTDTHIMQVMSQIISWDNVQPSSADYGQLGNPSDVGSNGDCGMISSDSRISCASYVKIPTGYTPYDVIITDYVLGGGVVPVICAFDYLKGFQLETQGNAPAGFQRYRIDYACHNADYNTSRSPAWAIVYIMVLKS
jgi:hypothetical protein